MKETLGELCDHCTNRPKEILEVVGNPFTFMSPEEFESLEKEEEFYELEEKDGFKYGRRKQVQLPKIHFSIDIIVTQAQSCGSWV